MLTITSAFMTPKRERVTQGTGQVRFYAKFATGTIF
jgi:hypothetical protein